MAKLAKNFVAHERMPKKTSQGNHKNIGTSTMNKNRRRSFKRYRGQGK